MQARYLPYVLIAPVSVFLGLFFLYPFYLVAQTAFYDGAGWSLKHFKEVTSYGNSQSRSKIHFGLPLLSFQSNWRWRC